MYKSVKKFFCYKLCFIFSIGLFTVSAQPVYPPSLKCYATQMHVHGLSNHNASPQPASMQWHSFYSDTTKTTILWWTDHREVFTQNQTSEFNFHGGVYDPATCTITGLHGTKNEPTKWVGVKTGGVVSVRLTDSSIFIDMKAETSKKFSSIYFSPRNDDKLLVGNRYFVRPVTSQPVIDFYLTTDGINTMKKAHVKLVLLMGYHYYNGITKQQTITYSFICNKFLPSRVLTDSSTLKVNIPVTNNIPNHIVLDVAADAKLLNDGIDNTTNDYRLLVEGKLNKSISATFSNIKIYSKDSSAYSQYLLHKQLGGSYGNRYGIQEYTGCEWTDFIHMNGFLPDSATNRAVLYDDRSRGLGPQYFSDQVHLRGGIVSYNHPFGSAGNAQSLTTQDYRTDTVAEYLLNNNAYNADYLEVGYTNRGGVDLAHHLKLWDILTANKLFLYGNGTNDSHGGTWFVNSNNFVTWIWATDSSTEKLINGLGQGKTFFGNNIDYSTTAFYFKVANAVMGNRKVPSKSTAPVHVQMSNGPANAEFRLTQGILQSGLVVNYLYHDFVFDTASPPCISLSEPCFIRISVYSNGYPVLFSNPIVFTSGALDSDSSICALHQKRNTDLNNNDFSVYPNPAKNECMLRGNVKEACNLKISLVNAEGRILKFFGNYNGVPGYNEFLFGLDHFPAGTYFILAENNSSKASVPFIITK